MSGEAVYRTLLLLIDSWDSMPVRVYQDGHWQNLYLSEITDGALVASQVLQFIASRHLPPDTEAPLPDALDRGAG